VAKSLRWIQLSQLGDTQTWNPDAGTEARILAGAIYNVTGTASILRLRDNKARETVTVFFYGLGAAKTGWYTLNPVGYVATCTNCEQMSDTKDAWFGMPFGLHFSGAATAFARVLVEIVKLDPETGAHLA